MRRDVIYKKLWPETGSWSMALVTMNLRLEAADGSGVEEYRVHDGDIEVRQTRLPLEHAQPEEQWRRLSASEIADHVDGNTVVAEWLRHRIGWQRLLLACTDKETRELFGVSESAEDRHAA